MSVDLSAVQAAAERIRPFVHRTPVLTSSTFDAELGAHLFFKCENLQKVGAFKARGAVNAVLSLPEAERAEGVVTHSSGNHAAALAYAARICGVRCTVVMPDTAPAIKATAVRGYGADIVWCKNAERQATADRVLAERGGTFVHPFDRDEIIAGQGTAALELLDEVGAVDVMVAPVGGGGLLGGTAIVTKSRCPEARVIGAEPEAVDDAYRSLQSGVRQPAVPTPQTIADGLLTGLGERNFAILQERDVEIITVDEPAIVAAARDVLERMKILIEPSAGTVLAVLRREPERWRGLRIGLVLSGGNTDFAWLER
ncbi:MAG: threonine/serine dehydratase [Planctomycetota bacterium]